MVTNMIFANALRKRVLLGVTAAVAAWPAQAADPAQAPVTRLAQCAGAFEANLELFRLAPDGAAHIEATRTSVALLLTAMARAVPEAERERFAYESAQTRDAYLTEVAAAPDDQALAARLTKVRDAGARCLTEVLPPPRPEAVAPAAAARPLVSTVGLRK